MELPRISALDIVYDPMYVNIHEVNELLKSDLQLEGVHFMTDNLQTHYSVLEMQVFEDWACDYKSQRFPVYRRLNFPEKITNLVTSFLFKYRNLNSCFCLTVHNHNWQIL